MSYVRKTVDVFPVLQLVCGEWVEVTEEWTRWHARQMAKCYRENQPEYTVKFQCRRQLKSELTESQLRERSEAVDEAYEAQRASRKEHARIMALKNLELAS